MSPADEPSLLADHVPGGCLSGCDLQDSVERIADQWVLKPGVERLLILPPDHTRLYSQAGQITASLWSLLADRVEIDVLPALGTHHAMTSDQLRMMFGEKIPLDRFIPHNWRTDLEPCGVVPGARLAELSDGRMTDPVEVAVNRRLVSGGYDLVLSIGQVVPHEVIGFANHSKNVCIGAGGGAMLHQSHFLGAVCGIEKVLGVADTPVRRLMDQGFYDYVRPRADVRFVLTVVEDSSDGPRLAGITAGAGQACFRWAAALAAEKNLTKVDRPIERAIVWLDPREFTSTWLGNKAVYRTRKAMADDGELIVLAPAVDTFGEDAEIDRLIRKYGYRGTPATLDALAEDPDLAANLSAAAHLIHGSSESRFRIVYATGPGLSRDEVTGAGYGWADCDSMMTEFGITDQTAGGWQDAPDGRPFFFVRNPALGLWTA